MSSLSLELEVKDPLSPDMQLQCLIIIESFKKTDEGLEQYERMAGTQRGGVDTTLIDLELSDTSYASQFCEAHSGTCSLTPAMLLNFVKHTLAHAP